MGLPVCMYSSKLFSQFDIHFFIVQDHQHPHEPAFDCSSGTAMLAIMIFVGIFEFIVAIVSLAYCCKAVCCGSVQAKQHQDMELRPPTQNKVSMKPRWSVDFGMFNERSQRKKINLLGENGRKEPKKVIKEP
jgi:hypothetical protein